MKRRELLVLVASALTAPRGLHAQQQAMPAIGFLAARSPGESVPLVAAFRLGLNETGYIEGQSVAIEYRWAEGHYDRLPTLAADLVSRKVAVVATTGGLATVFAAKNATATIPIVFLTGTDPVATGSVASLARPGGNLTGLSMLFTELTAKRLELLSKLVPGVKVIALLVNPNNPEAEPEMRDAKDAAGAKGVQLPILKVGDENEIDAAFATFAQLRAGALLVGNDPFFSNRREQLLALAARHAIPAMYFNSLFARSGGLISYGTSLSAQWRQLGHYVGRVLRGEEPADLPVQQPTTFELVVNLKTAKALGLTVPPSILARADEVIE